MLHGGDAPGEWPCASCLRQPLHPGGGAAAVRRGGARRWRRILSVGGSFGRSPVGCHPRLRRNSHRAGGRPREARRHAGVQGRSCEGPLAMSISSRAILMTSVACVLLLATWTYAGMFLDVLGFDAYRLLGMVCAAFLVAGLIEAV